MPFNYVTGEEIGKGGRVIYPGVAAKIEFVADNATKDSETDWYVKEYRGGVMILELEPKVLR